MRLRDLEVLQNMNPARDKKYYFVYARKSSESEDRQSASISTQLRETQEIIEKNHLPIKEVFTESKSAKQPGRPEFNRMMDELEKGEAKGIVCYHLDRLCRNPKDEGTLRWLLLSGQIEEIITPEKTYNKEDSSFNMAYEGSKAQDFITDLRKKTMDGTRTKIELGLAPILAPAGFRNCKEKNQGQRDIEPHPIYFPLVRKLFDLFLTNNYSVEALHKEAVKLEIKNSHKRIISRSQTYSLLQNPFYVGRFIYAKKLYNGVHKKMLTDEEFDRVQEILSKGSKPRAYKNEMLTGLLTCGGCQGVITCEVQRRHYKNGKTQEFAYYRCTKKHGLCNQGYIRAEKLEKQALAYLSKLELSPAFIEWAIRWLKIIQKNKAELRNTKQEQARQGYDLVQKKLDRLNDLMIEGAISSEEGLIKKQELTIERGRYTYQLDNAEQLSDEVDDLSIKTFEFVSTARERFKKGTVSERKIILRAIGSNLILKDKKLEIEIRKPFSFIQSVVSELGKTSEANFPKFEANIVTTGSSRDNLYPLPNDVRTYYLSLKLQELLIYKSYFNYV